MESAEDRTITVSEETARLIHERVDDGSFASPAKVIGAAMEALKREERENAKHFAAVKARIKASVEDPRPPVPLEEAFERICGRLHERSQS